MSRRFQLVCLALFGVCLLGCLLIEAGQNVQLADRYHSRNRTSNFYARSAGEPEKVNSGATVVGKKVVRRGTSQPSRRLNAR